MVSKFLVDHLHCMLTANFDADDELNQLRLSRVPVNGIDNKMFIFGYLLLCPFKTLI